MHAHRLLPLPPVKYLRQQVLPRMLLHMIVAPRPIDLPHNARRLFRQRLRQQMKHRAIRPRLNVDHSRVVQMANIMRLAAGRRIERRSVQSNGMPVLEISPFDYLCRKSGAVSVLVVNSYCHAIIAQGDTHKPSPAFAMSLRTSVAFPASI